MWYEGIGRAKVRHHSERSEPQCSFRSVGRRIGDHFSPRRSALSIILDDSDTGTDSADIHTSEDKGRVTYDGLGEITALYEQLNSVIDAIEQRELEHVFWIATHHYT